MASRYVIGIDLGTTNCALSFIDTQAKAPVSQVLDIPQIEAAGGTQDSPILPSFLYFPPEAGAANIVGLLARDQMASLPGRVVHSAKSWLCHGGVDREAKLLPWGADDISAAQKLSPVEVSARYLQHLRRAWDQAHLDADFARQDITVTVPASFDESAQFLTLQAAREAGFPERVRLLEEPQAAFYFWLEGQRDAGALSTLVELLPSLKERSQTVLICDIGGGTTDFSLLRVQPPAARQRLPRIERVAVSDHLLLGGDNIDLAIAHALEAKIYKGEKRLSSRQWSRLASTARVLKEKVLGSDGDPEETFSVSVAAEGSGLFSSVLSARIQRIEVHRLIEDGFFPKVERADRPEHGRTGLREMGLPFAADSAITRHLAGFLDGRDTDAVLFTGGSLKPVFLRQRLVEQITHWQGRSPIVLENNEMDLAVARGAACYGAALRRPAARIRGGYPHSVFLELYREQKDAAPQLVCVLPKGFEPGDKLKLSALPFELLLDRPVRFQIFTSNNREGDTAGDVLTLSEAEFHRLPPLQTQLDRKPGMAPRLEITLEATVSETGLLQIFCVHRPASGPLQRWQLDFNLRKTADETQVSADESLGVSDEKWKRAEERIGVFYGKKRGDLQENPKGLKRELEKILGLEMDQWNVRLLRALWGPLSGGGHRRSAAHEMTWLYLAGFCLRPGYGADLDPWRVNELWRTFTAGPAFPHQPGLMSQWWLLWRRVSGGLDAARQTQIFQPLVVSIQNRKDILPEVVLLGGSLERVPVERKLELGNTLVRQLMRHKAVTPDAHFWALGRLASRQPLYAGPEALISPTQVESWVDAILALDTRTRPNRHLFLSQACSLTGERSVDVSEALRARVIERMQAEGARPDALRRLQEVVASDRKLVAQAFGEDLPAGLKLA